MAKLYYDAQADLGRLKAADRDHRLWQQGHAHALNLRDSGLDVRVGLHATSKSRPKVESQELRVMSVADAAREAQLIMICTPDHNQRASTTRKSHRDSRR